MPIAPIGLFEQGVGGQDALTEPRPVLWHDRATSGCKDDAARDNLAALHRHPIRPQKPRPPDNGARTQIVTHLFRALDKIIAQAAHPRQHCGHIGQNGFGPSQPKVLEIMTTVESICGLD